MREWFRYREDWCIDIYAWKTYPCDLVVLFDPGRELPLDGENRVAILLNKCWCERAGVDVAWRWLAHRVKIPHHRSLLTLVVRLHQYHVGPKHARSKAQSKPSSHWHSCLEHDLIICSGWYVDPNSIEILLIVSLSLRQSAKPHQSHQEWNQEALFLSW